MRLHEGGGPKHLGSFMGEWEAFSQDTMFPALKPSSHSVFKGGLMNRKAPDEVQTSGIPFGPLELPTAKVDYRRCSRGGATSCP